MKFLIVLLSVSMLVQANPKCSSAELAKIDKESEECAEKKQPQLMSAVFKKDASDKQKAVCNALESVSYYEVILIKNTLFIAIISGFLRREHCVTV